MAHQGYPDEGSDMRLIPGFGWLQAALIMHWRAPQDVEQVTTEHWRWTAQPWPPFVMVEFKSKSGWYQFRVGWTWRIYQHYYILGAALKKEDGLEPDYTK